MDKMSADRRGPRQAESSGSFESCSGGNGDSKVSRKALDISCAEMLLYWDLVKR